MTESSRLRIDPPSLRECAQPLIDSLGSPFQPRLFHQWSAPSPEYEVNRRSLATGYLREDREMLHVGVLDNAFELSQSLQRTRQYRRANAPWLARLRRGPRAPLQCHDTRFERWLVSFMDYELGCFDVRRAGSNRSTIRSARTCDPCLRNEL